MYRGWLKGLVWFGDGTGFGSGSYSVFVDRVLGWSRLPPEIVAEMLSDSQSVPRVMNPRAEMGVAVRTLFVTAVEVDEW